MYPSLSLHVGAGRCSLIQPTRRPLLLNGRRVFTYRQRTNQPRVRCQAGGDEQNVTTAPQAPVLPPLPPPPSAVPVMPPADPNAVPADAAAAEYMYRTGAYAQVPPDQRQYYMQPPPQYPYMPPLPAPAAKAAPAPSGGIPWWIWFALGMVVIKFIDWVQEVMRKGPQQYMTEMMMNQMMKAMQNPGAPGSSPFGGAPPFGGAAPPFGGAAPPFGGQASPFGAAPPFGGFPTAAPPAQPAYDTTAAPAGAAAVDPSRPGDKFSQRLNTEGRVETGAAPAGSPLEVVEPVVKEPTGAQGAGSGPSTAAFFQDVNVNEPVQPPPSAASPSSNGAFGGMGQMPPQQQQQGGSQDMSAVTTMMEKMLRNPEMQKMLYPYLPEPMRNPQSIEWMLNNPEVKKQMETMLQQQGFNLPPQMMDMMKNMDLSEDRVNRQFQELGLKPEDVISKVMSNPELAQGFSDPKVQQAIMDITNSPMNIVKYQNDPQIMRVLEKINEIFAPSMPGAAQGFGGAPGYPPQNLGGLGMPTAGGGFPGAMPPTPPFMPPPMAPPAAPATPPAEPPKSETPKP